jgi:hypothetical protein
LLGKQSKAKTSRFRAVEEDEERRSWVAKSNTSEEKANQKTRRKARVESEAIGMISLQTLRKIDGSRDKTCAT